jgi:predicted Rossmann fold flavoprotein
VAQVESDARVELIVIGAGAAGLWAAARAAELGCEVLLLEKTPRTGTKVLASGGTRCNLTTTLAPADAARLFGPAGERFLRGAFRALPPAQLRARFEALGVPTLAEPLEKVFPASHRARDVRDALERWARAAGVRIECDSGVRGFDRAGDAWRVQLHDGRVLHARKLCVCPGGMSYPRTGTTGDGYAWLAALGLPLVEPAPALVPLVSPDAWVRELAGLSLQDVVVRLRAPDGALVRERARPVVFTHKGISGPGAMDLGEPVAREEALAKREGRAPHAHALCLDLAPTRDREVLRELLAKLAGRPGAPLIAPALASDLTLPRRIVARALAQAEVAAGARVNELARAGRHTLVEALKGLAIPVTGTLGFEQAEVTAGGLALAAVDAATLRVKGIEQLWVFGEILDLTGPIGGLNFQAAFSTAELAARDAARA